MDKLDPSGRIEVICGCMFSGKTLALILRVRRARIAGQKVLVFKHSLDDRYAVEEVASHDGIKLDAIPVAEAREILEEVEATSGVAVVAIDEAQFFGGAIVNVCVHLAEMGIRVIAAGLDMNFRGEPFGSMPLLMARAEMVDKLPAVCAICGGEAYFTQRLIGGEPASYDDPEELVGAQDFYQARCRDHHEVRNRPTL